MITIKNPIQRGFYPDPSICRVEENYYMVNSTFAYAPGIPIFMSKNLRDWVQIGHVLERKEQLCLERAKVSEGIYAPTIRYNDGIFYVIATNVSSGGNFYVTAKRPEGPWSDPIFLENTPGIDPSLFFDEKVCYYIGQRTKENPQYFGDCEIWIQKLDLLQQKLVGEVHILWDGSSKHAVWAEGPHLYRRGKYYYLMIAEGGTEYNHSVCIARSKSIGGPYESCAHNPILTHRHLGHDYSIQNIGHGDLIEGLDEKWFMVMLGTRPQDGCAELGRETFLAEIAWEEDWPIVNPGRGKVVLEQEIAHKKNDQGIDKSATKGTKMEWSLPLDKRFVGLRENPSNLSLQIQNGNLSIPILAPTVEDIEVPAYIGTRVLSRTFQVQVQVEAEVIGKEEVGLLYYYDEMHYIKVVMEYSDCGYDVVVVKQNQGNKEQLGKKQVLGSRHVLSIQGYKQMLSVKVDNESIAKQIDLHDLCAERAGGFVGCTVGIYASSQHEKSDNRAIFSSMSLLFSDE
ncbi:MAG: family 43 glycosylhydrolase [Velocimicrobium sp.]